MRWLWSLPHGLAFAGGEIDQPSLHLRYDENDTYSERK